MINSYFNHNSQPLDVAQLRIMAPSIFAGSAYHEMSSRYGFIPTSAVLEALRREGWLPVAAQEQRVRLEDKRGFTRHVVRFRHGDVRLENVGDVLPEIVLLNSHDGTSAYQMHAGLFRLACRNGLVVADSTFQKIAVRHQGDVVGRVIEGTAEVVRDLPRITHQVQTMRAITLQPEEQRIFADAAMTLRESTLPLAPEQVLRPRRAADTNPDLWTTYNVVQENLIRGGLRTRTATGRRTSTRAVSSIQEDTKLNKALWQLAEQMAALKGTPIQQAA